ncbi:hypothetical protein N1851_020332 [Merluccius polli]|uniref:Uncharacterized protein n=1 Tax=Merluccius polli TaxID=89951 RepID=A0AA47MKZ9_MERPO|nr:hypothetical protein N1851_020332 [Merluccius polli]
MSGVDSCLLLSDADAQLTPAEGGGVDHEFDPIPVAGRKNSQVSGGHSRSNSGSSESSLNRSMMLVDQLIDLLGHAPVIVIVIIIIIIIIIIISDIRPAGGAGSSASRSMHVVVEPSLHTTPHSTSQAEEETSSKPKLLCHICSISDGDCLLLPSGPLHASHAHFTCTLHVHARSSPLAQTSRKVWVEGGRGVGLCRGAVLVVEATGSRLLGAWPGQKTGEGVGMWVRRAGLWWAEGNDGPAEWR